MRNERLIITTDSADMKGRIQFAEQLCASQFGNLMKETNSLKGTIFQISPQMKGKIVMVVYPLEKLHLLL